MKYVTDNKVTKMIMELWKVREYFRNENNSEWEELIDQVGDTLNEYEFLIDRAKYLNKTINDMKKYISDLQKQLKDKEVINDNKRNLQD